jgi:hypothetical protein
MAANSNAGPRSVANSSALKEIRDFRVTGNGSRPDAKRLTACTEIYAAAAFGARAVSLAFLYLDRNQRRPEAGNRQRRWHGGEVRQEVKESRQFLERSSYRSVAGVGRGSQGGHWNSGGDQTQHGGRSSSAPAYLVSI